MVRELLGAANAGKKQHHEVRVLGVGNKIPVHSYWFEKSTGENPGFVLTEQNFYNSRVLLSQDTKVQQLRPVEGDTLPCKVLLSEYAGALHIPHEGVP